MIANTARPLEEHATDRLDVEVGEVAGTVAFVEDAEFLHLFDGGGLEIDARDQAVVVVGRDRQKSKSA